MSPDRDVSQPRQTYDTVVLINITILVIVCIFYANRIFFHPLARVPGPLLAKCTSLWQIYHSYVGDECTAVRRLHSKHGKVVRIGPNLIDIADGAALGTIYLDKRFLKPSSYHNAYTDGFATMFSTSDPAYRAPRAKAVAPLFSKAAIGRDKDLIYQSVERFIQRLEKGKSRVKGRPIDLQEHTRALGIDVLAYDRLREEILANRGKETDVQQLPYLQGVIKEGFRLAPANATRLPRVVPSSGWHFNGHYFPPGTTVGIASPQLFFDGQTYPDPTEFRPGRWATPSAEMQRDLVPFSLGIRQCIAKNLATAELYMAVEKIVESDILRGAKAVQDNLELWEWFNVAVKGNKIELVWTHDRETSN
ncbi:MAG: hypothetical protein Q9216_003099 [Gyalolechia sp. 2 TL-2023]